jgi:hypothetical protein
MSVTALGAFADTTALLAYGVPASGSGYTATVTALGGKSYAWHPGLNDPGGLFPGTHSDGCWLPGNTTAAAQALAYFNNKNTSDQGSRRLTNVVDPVDAQDVATKNYVDGAGTVEVPTSRTIATTAPLTGGGDLSANRTLAISAATGSTAGSMSAADKTKLDAIPSDAQSKAYTDAGDAASLASANTYTDGQVTGLSPKKAVRAATTGSIATLAAASVVVDGVTLVAGDRLLVKDTASADGIEALSGKRNGIYVVGTVLAGVAPLTRASDADTAAEIGGASVFVDEGTVNGSTSWGLGLAAEDITLNTTVLTFVKVGYALGTATPTALGTAAAGTSGKASNDDHVHPNTGIMQCMEFAVAHAATVDSATSLPAGAHVYKVRFKIGTQYSANATLDVGQASHTTDFVNHSASGADPALSDLSLLAVGDVIDVDGITAAAVVGAVRASIGGSPAAGAGTMMVSYAVPNT